MRATATRVAVLLLAFVFPGWGGPQNKGDNTTTAHQRSAAANPTLFEVRQQCNEIAAFFPVDVALARRWVPPRFKLAIGAQGKAGGGFIFMNCPHHFLLTTPNSPPLQTRENTAPGAVVHLWFMLEGPAEVLAVSGAQVTAPTQYAYAVADLVTSSTAVRVYRRAGKNAILIGGATLVDEGKRQRGQITFTDRSKITFEAYTPTELPEPLRLGGNASNWHVVVPAEMGDDDSGVRHDSATEQPGNVNTTRVMFLATVPGPPNSTQVTIHADAGTPFADFYGSRDVVSSRATFFRPNNIVNNSSRGELAWTTYPPSPIPVPPLLP